MEGPSGEDRKNARDGNLPEEEESVTPLELFFDLVFVFALTQVTSLMSAVPTWTGIGRGMLVLSAIWWAWVSYSWLANTIDPNEDRARIVIFAAMSAMFVVALAAPRAFDDYGILFACAYFVVRALHILLYTYASPDRDIAAAVKRLAPGVLVGCSLLVVAATQDGIPQTLLWMAAIAADFAAPIRGGMRGWSVQPSHFAERHGLIVIIALGESIVAVGVALEGQTLDASIVVTAALGLLVAGTLWWTYFDISSIAAERNLGRIEDEREQARLARDSYSYLHLPMVAGILLMALGVKKAVAHPGDPLDFVPAFALCAGVAVYLLGHVAFRRRNIGTWNTQRCVAAAGCLAVIPLATHADATVAVGAIALLGVVLIAYEAVAFRHTREEVRTGGMPTSLMKG